MAEEWAAIESNPEVLTTLGQNLGATKLQVCDVFGLDEELLAMIPEPCLSLIVLFPTNKGSFSGSQKESNPTTDSVVVPQDKLVDAFYIDQVVALPNACGTIALLHAITNNAEALGVSPDSAVGRFRAQGLPLTPTQRGNLLDSFPEIKQPHNAMVLEGLASAT